MPLDLRKDIFGKEQVKNSYKRNEGVYRGVVKNKNLAFDKKVSRRDFLKSAVAVTGAGALLVGGKEIYDSFSKLKNEESVPEEVLSNPEDLYQIQELAKGVSLLVDSRDGFPSYFAVKGDEEWKEINREAIFNSIDRARLSGEVEIAVTQDIPGLVDKELFDDGVDRSIEKLPEDVLSPEELKKFGVEIIQADVSKLYIRKSAFGEGGILKRQTPFYEKFKYGDEVKDIGDFIQNRLIIGVLDSGVVCSNAISGDRYSKIREIFGVGEITIDDPEVFRKKSIADFEKALDEMRVAGDVGLDGPMLFAKNSIENFKTMTENELQIMILGGGHPDSYGKLWINRIDDGGLTHNVILLTAGETKRDHRLSIGVDAQGNYEAKVVTAMQSANMAPRASMGDFSPVDKGFIRGTRVNSFPFVHRHEMTHYGYAVFDEKKTDEMTWDDIQRANEMLKMGDDSGYSFVWSLPNGRYVRG